MLYVSQYRAKPGVFLIRWDTGTSKQSVFYNPDTLSFEMAPAKT